MASKTVHIPVPVGHPQHPGRLFVEPPLWCGRARTPETVATVFHTKATCKRCLKLDAVYREDWTTPARRSAWTR